MGQQDQVRRHSPANLVEDMPLIGWDYKVRADTWQAVIDTMVASGELKSKRTADEYLRREDQALRREMTCMRDRTGRRRFRPVRKRWLAPD